MKLNINFTENGVRGNRGLILMNPLMILVKIIRGFIRA